MEKISGFSEKIAVNRKPLESQDDPLAGNSFAGFDLRDVSARRLAPLGDFLQRPAGGAEPCHDLGAGEGEEFVECW